MVPEQKRPPNSSLELSICHPMYDDMTISTCSKKEKKRKTTQAEKHSLHQLRKRRHIGPKCRESPPPKVKRKLVGIWRVAGSPLPQTETLRAICSFKCASSQFVCIMHRVVQRATASAMNNQVANATFSLNGKKHQCLS